MKTLKELKETSPCPVDLNWDNPGGGMFFPFTRQIVVSKDLAPAKKFAILSHEIQHAKCYEKGCFCMKGRGDNRNFYYQEYHAIKAELLECLDYKEALVYAIYIIKGCVTGEWGWPRRIKAARNIVKTKLWAKACLRSV